MHAKSKTKNVAVKSTDVLSQLVGVATSNKPKKSSDEVPIAKNLLDRVSTDDNKQGRKQPESNSKPEKNKHKDAAKLLKQDKSSKVQPAKSEIRSERVKRLLISFQMKLHCLFIDNNILVFEKVNILLQIEKSMIHTLRRERIGLSQSLLVPFVLPKTITDIPLLEVKFSDKKTQKVDEDLVFGDKMKQYIATHITGTASEAEPQAVILDESNMKSIYLFICLFIPQQMTMFHKSCH